MADDLLSGLTLLSFESRRAGEIGELIAGHGGRVLSAPSMREIALGANDAAHAFLDRLQVGGFDVVVFLTGVGTEALVAALAAHCTADRLAELLRNVTVVARGPKPRAALRRLGREPDHTVPEPNTWRELLQSLQSLCSPLRGARLAVQEYGVSNRELMAALAGLGVEVTAVPVYRWALPEDLEPLRDGIRALAAGSADVVLFTSAQQCAHVMQIAGEMELTAAVLAAARRTVVASVGPICSEALRAAGWPVDIEPEKPKMGPLVRQVAAEARRLLARKRPAAP